MASSTIMDVKCIAKIAGIFTNYQSSSDVFSFGLIFAAAMCTRCRCPFASTKCTGLNVLWTVATSQTRKFAAVMATFTATNASLRKLLAGTYCALSTKDSHKEQMAHMSIISDSR